MSRQEVFWRHVKRLREKRGYPDEIEAAMLWAAEKLEDKDAHWRTRLRGLLEGAITENFNRQALEDAMCEVVEAAHHADTLVDVPANEGTLEGLVEAMAMVRKTLEVLEGLVEETR